jgi:hypothetical protein
MRYHLEQPGGCTLGTLLEAAGDQSYGLIILVMALPSLVPGLNVGAAPLGGVALLAIGWQMLRGVHRPWIPERIVDQPIHKSRLKETLARLEGRLQRLDSHPGTPRRPLNLRWMGLLVAWTGFLLALPVPLPFGNLLPAATLTLLGAALLEERRAWGWLGAAGTVGTTIYFALSADLITHASHRAYAVLRHWFA